MHMDLKLDVYQSHMAVMCRYVDILCSVSTCFWLCTVLSLDWPTDTAVHTAMLLARLKMTSD